MDSDVKTILWAEFGVIFLALGVIHNNMLNNTWDSISMDFTWFSPVLLFVKYFLRIEGGWVY